MSLFSRPFTFFFSILLFTNFLFKVDAEIALTLEETTVLEKFFRCLLEESETGYVLLGQKPVCIYGYLDKNSFSSSRTLHKHSVGLKEGAKIWKKIGRNTDKNNIYIHIFDVEDPVAPGYKHVLIINLPLFHKVVNENLPLFQFILGPTVTSERLLDAIITKNQPLHSHLKNNNALVGILLGYGTQNSLYVSRIEALLEVMEKTVPPFLRSEECILVDNQEHLPLRPSFGYQSLKEELAELEQRIHVSSEKLVEQKPPYIFGWVKDSETKSKHIYKLEQTQSDIQKILASPTFLEQILEKILGKKIICSENKKFKFSLNGINKEEILAIGIYEAMRSTGSLNHFIDGLCNSNPRSINVSRKAWAPNYREEIISAKKNLAEADAIFSKLSMDSQFQCLIPQKLYYKVTNCSDDPISLSGSAAFLDYSVFSPLGQCLANEQDVLVNFKNTIAAFWIGTKGMLLGETRELWIHPCLAYGFDTPLEKCLYLKAVVTFRRNSITINQDLSTLKPFDLDYLNDPKLEKSISESYEAVLFQKGTILRNLLAQDKTINIAQIVEILKKIEVQKNIDFSKLNSDQEAINKIFWNIYFS